ncbi:MAG: alpha/beta hydrolase [Candidatus Izimaplasma sp.]|nr:alpha/beta hydrolase [Candidatus Izimaplasma bacterium]
MKEYSVFKLFSEELDREMKLFVSLPRSYYKTKKFYPVLYMCDGQNLFDDSLATYGKSWGILEAYENFLELPEVIIVGIESNELRSDELVPFKFQFEENGKVWGGKTDNYLDFVSNTLKSYINRKYRTFKSAKNTGIMGSSFGGVCATYAALKYGDQFSRFGCVSNAYFPIQKEMIQLSKKANLSKLKRIYMDVGTNESENKEENILYLESNQEVYDILRSKVNPENIKFEIIKGAIHNESAWEKRFPGIIKYLFN